MASMNYNLIGDILTIARRKSLTLTWNKVKGHSGILENEIADELVSQAAILACSNSALIIHDHNLLNQNWKFIVQWQNLTWNESLRKNFSSLSFLFYCSDWSHN